MALFCISYLIVKRVAKVFFNSFGDLNKSEMHLRNEEGLALGSYSTDNCMNFWKIIVSL